MAEFPRGRFCWHELMTSDLDAAASFYKQVVGWSTMSWPQDPSYRLWVTGQTQLGGLMVLPEDAKSGGAPPNWLFYVAVPDAAGTARRVGELGGQVVKSPMSIDSVGTIAILQDPQGAVFAVLQPLGDAPGHDGEPKLGEFSWHELATTDPDAAWRFYQAIFGWKETSSFDMGPAGTYRMYGRVGIPLGGIFRKPFEMPGPPSWLCYARVPNADKAAATVSRLGGRILNGPMEVPGGDRVAQCMDPQGAMFAVHSTAPAQAKPARSVARPKKAKAKKSKKTRGSRSKPAPKKKSVKAKRKSKSAKSIVRKVVKKRGESAKKTTRRKKATRRKTRSG